MFFCISYILHFLLEPINTFFSRSHNNDDNPPIRLSYHGNVHYNSIIDPYNPTVGVGLGLAGYKPDVSTDAHLRIKLEPSLLECTENIVFL